MNTKKQSHKKPLDKVSQGHILVSKKADCFFSCFPFGSCFIPSALPSISWDEAGAALQGEGEITQGDIMIDFKYYEQSKPLDARLTSTYPTIKEKIQIVEGEISLSNLKKETRYREMLKIVIINALDNWRNDYSTHYSRREESYTTPSRYGQLYFSYTRTLYVIDQLVEKGYLFHRAGRHDLGYQSIFIPTQKLIDLFADTPIVKKRIPYADQIILKNENKKLVDYKDTRYTNRARKFAEKYNLINKPTYTIPTTSSIGGREWTEVVEIPQQKTPKTSIDTNLYRVYNINFGQGGRWYGAEYQQFSGDKRSTILADGLPTIELDYSTLHPSMCWALVGRQLDLDPYVLCEDVLTRPLGKLMFMALINSDKGLQGAKQVFRAGISNATKRNGRYVKLSEIDNPNKEQLRQMANRQLFLRLGYSVDELFKSALKVYEPVKKFLYTGYGKKLQKKDGDMAEAIMKYFAKKHQIKILCIHDSFIVPQQYGDELERVMKDTYKKTMGFNIEVH